MDKQVTRDEMIQAVSSRVESYAKWADAGHKGKGSFAQRGAQHRMEVGQSLLRRLNSGGIPSTQEVVGYFGKGARWAG